MIVNENGVVCIHTCNHWAFVKLVYQCSFIERLYGSETSNFNIRSFSGILFALPIHSSVRITFVSRYSVLLHVMYAAVSRSIAGAPIPLAIDALLGREGLQGSTVFNRVNCFNCCNCRECPTCCTVFLVLNFIAIRVAPVLVTEARSYSVTWLHIL